MSRCKITAGCNSCVFCELKQLLLQVQTRTFFCFCSRGGHMVDHPAYLSPQTVLTFVLSRHRSVAPHTPRILLHGPPGSGKSLQAALIAQKYNIVNSKPSITAAPSLLSLQYRSPHLATLSVSKCNLYSYVSPCFICGSLVLIKQVASTS